MEVTTQGGGLRALMDLFRKEEFLKKTFLLPSDFLQGPVAKLARECAYGKRYSEETHIPLRDWIVIPYMEEAGSISVINHQPMFSLI
jgi:hypothetical protein